MSLAELLISHNKRFIVALFFFFYLIKSVGTQNSAGLKRSKESGKKATGETGKLKNYYISIF